MFHTKNCFSHFEKKYESSASQQTFTHTKSTTDAPEKGKKHVQR